MTDEETRAAAELAANRAKLQAAIQRLLDPVPRTLRRLVAASMLHYLSFIWLLQIAEDSGHNDRKLRHSADEELRRMHWICREDMNPISLNDIINKLGFYPRDLLQPYLEQIADERLEDRPPLDNTGTGGT